MQPYPRLSLPHRSLYYLTHFPVLAGVWAVGFLYFGIVGHFSSCPWYVDVLLVLLMFSSIKVPHLAFCIQPFAAVLAASALGHYTKYQVALLVVLGLWLVSFCVAAYTIHKLKRGDYVVGPVTNDILIVRR